MFAWFCTDTSLIQIYALYLAWSKNQLKKFRPPTANFEISAHTCITPMVAKVYFLFKIYGLNSPNYVLPAPVRLTKFTGQSGLNE